MEEEERKGNREEEPLPPPPDEEPLPPPPVKDNKVKVSVIKPFKPRLRVSKIVPQGKCFYHPVKPASYICSSCGKSVCSVCAQYHGGIYFCPQCAPAYIPRRAPSPPPSTTDDKSWYRALFSIGIIILIIGAILALLYWPLTSINAAEFESLMEKYYDEGSHNFKDYRQGDTIVIRDTIVRISVDYDSYYGVVTFLWFESTGKGDLDFNLLFDADLERDYNVGDTVSITLHVEEDSSTRDEVIREYNRNLPNISNIDHTISIDLIFLAMIIFGGFLVFIGVLFLQKLKKQEAAKAGLMEESAEESVP